MLITKLFALKSCLPNCYLADAKIMIAIATMVSAAATTPHISRTAFTVFSLPLPEHIAKLLLYHCTSKSMLP